MNKKNIEKTTTKKRAKARATKPMKAAQQAKPKSNKQAAKATTATKTTASGEKTKRVRNYRRHAKTEISKSFTKICKTLVEKAEEGSIGHTKLLFDVGGLKDDVKKSQTASGPSLGELLLKEIEKQRQEEAADTDLSTIGSGNVES